MTLFSFSFLLSLPLSIPPSVSSSVFFFLLEEPQCVFFASWLNWCQNGILMPQWFKFLISCVQTNHPSVSTSVFCPFVCNLRRLMTFIQNRTGGSMPPCPLSPPPVSSSSLLIFYILSHSIFLVSIVVSVPPVCLFPSSLSSSLSPWTCISSYSSFALGCVCLFVLHITSPPSISSVIGCFATSPFLVMFPSIYFLTRTCVSTTFAAEELAFDWPTTGNALVPLSPYIWVICYPGNAVTWRPRAIWQPSAT